MMDGVSYAEMGQREARQHQQRKRVARQAKLAEEAEVLHASLTEAAKAAERATTEGTLAERTAALNRLRGVIDEARPVQSHHEKLPEAVQQSALRLEQLKELSVELEKAELEERAKR